MTDSKAAAARGQLGQVASILTDVLVRHAEPGAKIGETARQAVRDAWLEKLETHTSAVIGPMIDAMAGDASLPPEVAAMLERVKAPSAQFHSILQQLFLYGIAFQLAGTMLAPFTQQMANDIWSAHADRPITPPDVATAVVRGIDFGDTSGVDVPDWAIAEAAKSGLGAKQFKTLVGVTGMAPDMTLLFEMIRRQVIDAGQLTEGIKQGDIKDEWIPFVEKMRYAPPSPIDLVQAALRGINPEDAVSGSFGVSGAGGTGPASDSYVAAKKWAGNLGLEPAGWVGGNPDWFDMLYSVAGRPPGPVELAHAALRGFIPWTGTGADAVTFEQGIAESDVKTKWTGILRQLSTYYPPPGTVNSLLVHGGITREQAASYYAADGIPPEIADAYAHLAEVEQITQDKALAKGDILTLVQEQLIPDDEALTALAQIGYTDGNAAALVKMAHWRYSYEALRSAVRTIGRYYATWKINATGATNALIALGLETGQAAELVKQLEVQRATTSPLPTGASIASAFNYGVIDQSTAMGMLNDLGYSPWNAWLVLSTRKHGPLPDEPSTGRPAGQPTAAQIAQEGYNAAVAAAQSLYDETVANAKATYLATTPPQSASYDAAVTAAKAALDQAVAAAAATYPQATS